MRCCNARSRRAAREARHTTHTRTTDIVTAFDHYLAEAGVPVAADFVRAIDDCMQCIERFPEAGSPRYAELLDVEGLRFAVVERFPYLMFYLEQADYVDVVRVLHQRQDIPALLVE